MMVDALIYKHFAYQEDVLEGNKSSESIKKAYDRWSNLVVITAITPKYIKVELPNKTKLDELVSYYNDYKILNGLWVCCADYDKDIDQFYWCKNWVQALMRKLLCRFRCSGPYLIHIIDLRG